ncbi:MAG: proton-conducting transporter membrane subunit [Desulfurococcaceae archaeon]
MSSCSASLLGALTPMLASAAFLLPLFSLRIKNRVFYYFYSVAFATLTLAATAWGFIKVSSCSVLTYTFGGWPPPYGIAYRVDVASGLLALFTSVVMWFIVLYSVWYGKYIDDVVWYYTLLLGMESGLLGCLLTSDVFNLFVMLEVLSISAYGLVAYYRSRPDAVEAAMKYAFIGAVATTLYFISTVIIYGCYGTLNMVDLSIKAKGGEGILLDGFYGEAHLASAAAISLALWTFTFKSALFPNHFWLPDAHPEAPTPVSAALSGLVVNIGAYATLRFMYSIFGQGSIIDVYWFRTAVFTSIAVMASLSAVIGALLMLVQSDVKKFLAYSTISHIGLIYLGIASGLSGSSEATIIGIEGSIYHIVNHGVGKALLFLATGVLIAAAKSRNIEDLAGLGRRFPLTSIAILIGILHLAGVAPLGGFFSKLYLFSAYISVGIIPFALFLIVASAISLLGYVKLIYTLMLKAPAKGVVSNVGLLVQVLVLVMSALCLVLGVWYTDVSKILAAGAESFLNVTTP